MFDEVRPREVGLVIVGAVLATGILIRRGLAWCAVAMVLFVACLAPAYDLGGYPRETWLFPLQEHRSEAYLVLALSLLAGLVTQIRSRSLRDAGAPAMALLLIGIYQGLLRIHHDTPAEGLETIAFAVFTVGVLMISLPVLVRRSVDRPRMLRAVLWADIAWIGAIMVQVAVDPSKLVMGNRFEGLDTYRFAGLTSNAQSAAIVFSISAVVSLWMAMYDTKRSYRVLSFVLACLNSVLLAWTGSRMGAIALFLGMSGILRRRLARSLGWVAAAVLSGYGLYTLVADYGLSDVAARLTSTDDSGRWERLDIMLRDGLAHPMFGTGIYDVRASENSYLLAFAAFGLGMLLLVFLLLAVSAWGCMALARASGRVLQYRAVVDLVIAFNVMYFVIALFEGIILARVREAVVFMLIFSSLSAALRRDYAARAGPPRTASRPSRIAAFARRPGGILSRTQGVLVSSGRR